MTLSATPKYDIEPRINVMVPMRDNVRLSTEIFIPKGCGKSPVILTRTPYGNNDPMRAERLLWFTRHGFATAFQDCRGRFDSEGEWEPFRSERNDGMDTIEWLSHQDFCNGSVGVTGRSYEGYCTWMVAYDNHPALKAIVPIVPLPDPVINVPYQNGALFWNMIVWSMMVHGRTNQNTGVVDWVKLYNHVPLRTLDKAAGMNSQTWQNWLDHPTLDEWWKEVCYMDKFNRVNIPALHVCGWYDDDGISTYKNFPGMRNSAKSKEAKEKQQLIIGCWPHKTNVSSVVGEIDFGPQALIDLNSLMFRFFARHLANEEFLKKEEPRCRIFVMGENRWHGFDDWPIQEAKKSKLYLHSNGNANSLFGDGALSIEEPSNEEVNDSFNYDPDDPVPYITDPVALQLGEACDQQTIERRPDVLVYTSKALDKDVIIIGRVFAEVYFSTDVRGTDITAKLVDVYPNGRSIQICDGIQRVEYRNSLEKPQWLKDSEVYKVTVDMWATGLRFLKGHSIRLEIAGSAVPKFTRHLNTDTDPSTETNAIIAHNKVYHTQKYPSSLIVDMIEEELLSNTVIDE